MKSRSMRYILILTAMLVGVAVVSASAQERDRVYSMEGAWYGQISMPDYGLTVPTLDTFTSNPDKPGLEGTFLCTIPAVPEMANPRNPSGYLKQTPSGHGNWVRIGRNKYAFTAMRNIFDENGNLFGLAKTWGTITPISKSEYTGTANTQFLFPDGTPYSPVFTGSMHSQRVAITLPQ